MCTCAVYSRDRDPSTLCETNRSALEIMNDIEEESARCCKLCSFRCIGNYLLLKHLFEAHSGIQGFSLECPVSGCSHTFSQGASFSSFLCHANRKHQNRRDKIESSRAQEIPASSGENAGSHPSGYMGTIDVTANHSNSSVLEPQSQCVPVHDPRVTAGKFLLTLKERHRLSQVAISFTINSVQEIVSQACHNIRTSAATAGVSISSEALDPFCGLDTDYLQSKFYEEHFGLVVSVE